MPSIMDISSSTRDDEFSQGLILPPLVIQLKKILDQYSDDTQILKELIQNAEDAGATEVKFLYDKRSYGRDSRYLQHPELANFQGPALCAYNDGVFSDDDWRGIRMLSQSVKHNDTLKVGHFGIGFKSVFHLTDMPSILSGDRLGYIDPHQYAFSASSHGLNISRRSDLLATIPHQIEPFIDAFNCDSSTFRSGHYKGTLFRFPLRARPSPLSADVYSEEKLQALLKAFESEAHLLLLFLRNIEQISVYQRESNTKTCRLVFRVALSADCVADVRKKRADFVAQVRSSDWLEKPLIATYPLTITTESIDGTKIDKRSHRFLVTNYCCGGAVSPIFRNLHKDSELGLLPLVGAAMKLESPGAATDGDHDDDRGGRLFCFLPLPLDANTTTRLPVHINAFFALEQNRKYVKWPGTLMSAYSESHMDKGLLWNQCLMKEAIPRAYIHMLSEAIRLHSLHVSIGLTADIIYHAMADPARLDRKFESVVCAVYVEMLKRQMIYYESADGCEWIEPRLAVFNNLDKFDECADVVTEVVNSSSVKMVTVPSHVITAVKKYAHFSVNHISPTLVAAAYRDVQSVLCLHWESKMKILRYLLRQSKFELIDGLELLPLANGGFDLFHFNPKKADRPIYIVPSAELQALLPGLKDDFMEMDIDEDIKNLLTKAATRGYTQLKVLDASLVGQLLPKCLPSTWLHSKDSPVQWNPSTFGHPPAGWLEALWLFLVRYSARDLSIVEGMPLLPCRTIRKNQTGSDDDDVTVELIGLSANNVCVARVMDGVRLGPEVEEVVRKLGITVVEELPDYVKSHQLVIRTYVFAPTYLGVLRAIERRCTVDSRENVANTLATDTTPEQKRALRELFAKLSVYEIPRSCLELLSHLPLFETTASIVNGLPQTASFASVANFGVAAPSEQLPFRISRPLINTTTGDSQALAKLLGVKSLNMAQLLSQVVFPDIESAYYDNVEVRSIMLYVLRHYNYFIDVDRGFRKTLRSLPFLPKSDMLLTVDRFYDPDPELLQKLFLFEENFPPGEYADSSIVAVLREVGLRGVEDVEPEDLLESAHTIQQLYRSTTSAGGNSAETMDLLVRKSDALLEYLHRHKSRLRAPCANTTLAAAMRDISWVRSMGSRPTFYPTSLPWCSANKVFFKPSEMVIRAHMNLVGSVQPVIAAEVYAEVAQEFGWDAPPTPGNVVVHLSNIILSFDVRDRVHCMEMTRSIYSQLAKLDPSIVAGLLAAQRVPDSWIFHGEGFTSPDRLVLVQPFMDLRPYVYSLPGEITAFSEFFSNFGVRTACNLIDVLCTIKVKYDGEGQPQTPTGLVRGKRFTETEVKRDLHICVCILNELKSHLEDAASLHELQQQLYVPVHSESRDTLKMAPLLQCSYCDEEWMRQGYSTGDLANNADDNVTLVHPNVPSSTAEALGIPTLMSKVLEGEELDYSFGQTDSLTHRLNTLLDEYSDGFAVPKELVQNADDAGATEIHFLYDERSNADAMTCLIDDGMKECHGPALWVYNNAVFTDDDFENITKLNGATKENQTDKIGRFGLGFNAVYNLTDVPTFVSRHYIVIFDPHTTYLGKSIRNKSKPGLKLDMRRHKRKLRNLGNQFKPFNDVFGCDLRPTTRQDSYPGTLFRLPLRTKVQASRSEICQKHYDDAEMRSLLRTLIFGAENLLLFTQNIQSISVHHLPSWSTAISSDMAEIFRITKKPVRFIRELNPVVVLANDVYKSLDKETQQFIGQSSMLRSATETMRQIRRGVSVDRLQLPDSSMVIRLESEITSGGENLLTVARRRTVQNWLVCGSMSRLDSLKMALQEEYLLPTAGVAVPLQPVPNTTSSYLPIPITDPSDNSLACGAIFSYLPLPIRSGLPVHINGMFAVTSNRRNLCELNEDDKFDVRAVWNETLLKDAVASTYVKLLVDLVSLSSSASRQSLIFSLWPRSNRIELKSLSLLVKSFYQELSGTRQLQRQPALFTDGANWTTFDNTLFLDCPYDRDDLTKSCLEVCRQCCVSNASKVVVPLTQGIRQEFMSAELDQLMSARTYGVAEFFKQILLPNIDTVIQEDRDLLLLDAILRGDSQLKAIIKEFHCIPASPDGIRLRQPAKLVDPASSLAQLYLPNDARFPWGDETYARADVLEALRNMGMKKSPQDLTWAEIIERAHIISTTKGRDSVMKLTSSFLMTLGDKLAENSTFVGLRQIQQQLLDIAFIPAMTKPQSFPLTWKASESPNENELVYKPAELYSAECKDLVGCVHLVADGSVFPKDCAELLGFLRLGMEWKEPPITMVLEQLDVLTNTDTENYFHDDRVMDEIQRMCFSVCSFFQSKLDSNIESRSIREMLTNRYFVLGFNRFLAPKQIAFEFTYNCAPYLYPVPDTYRRHYTELLKAVGVRDRFEVKDYVYALQSMHDIYGEEPLDKEELRLSLQLVTLLNESLSDAGTTMTEVVAKFGSIFVPDSRNRLSSATELCYNEPDCNWVPPSGNAGTAGSNVAFSHPMIPYTMSRQLGVNTRRQDVLSKHSRGIGFGQRESLTNRIKRILSGYPCDKEILKELLQNADDAGATEIYFVKDPRQHGTERIFDHSWRPLQGPALCVYNNRPFTEADLLGIQQLGQGSKSLDPNKTGQYGVGFNCVYHLTDAPSFLTKGKEIGETLCVFDPHASFVPGATMEEPGRRYDDLSQLRKIFTDVFPTYLEDIFSLDNGTMFRFPLRTEELAKTSDLSDQHVTLEDVDQLFAKFRQEVFDCMLFVNNVTSISMAEVNTSTKKLSNIYTVTVEMSDHDRSVRQKFFDKLKTVGTDVQSGKLALNEVPIHEAIYTVTVKDSVGCKERWLVTQRLGVDRSVKVAHSLIDAVRSKDLALLPRGGVAAQLDVIGDDDSKRRPCKTFCFLPLPMRSDLPVHVNGHFALDHEARRNLWTDEDRGTKTEWNMMLIRDVITPAYVALLRTVRCDLSSSVVNQNVSMMDSFGEDIPSIESYAKLFPVLTKQTSPGYWRSLTESFYRRIHESEAIVLPIVRPCFDPTNSSMSTTLDCTTSSQTEVEWVSTGDDGVGKPFFDNLAETMGKSEDRLSSSASSSARKRRSRSSVKKPHHEVLRHVLLTCGFRLVRLPLHIYESFVIAGVDIQCISPRSVIDFFSMYKIGALRSTMPTLPADIGSTPFGNSAALKVVHDYCSQDVAYFRSNLVGLPLLLCEDGQLRQFSNRDRVFLSVHHELLPGLSSSFIHHSYVGVIFKDVDVESCSVFRRFDVAAFGSLLPNVLSAAQYRWKVGQPAVQWNRQDNDVTVPSERWLFLVWNFLCQEFDRLLSIQTSTSINEVSLAKSLLEPIKDWCLIPAYTVKVTNRLRQSYSNSPRASLGSTSDDSIAIRYLVPLQLADTILDYSQSSIINQPVRQSFGRIGIPELDCRLLDGTPMKRTLGQASTMNQSTCSSSFTRLFVSSLEQPSAVLRAVHFVLVICSHGVKLTPEECFIVLKYFNESVDLWQNDDEASKILRNLPLHFALHDNVVCLGPSKAFLLHDEMPNTDMENWQQKASIILLRSSPSLTRLYDVLDCPDISVIDAYLQYIFPNFDYLTSESRLSHLQYIRDYKLQQLRGDEKTNFINGLTNLAFLSLPDGKLHTAGEFCDPYHPVFKTMLRGSVTSFPPPPYDEFSWLEFLKMAGLKTEISADSLVEFARQIASKAKHEGASEELFRQSRTLVTYLFKMADLPTSGLLEKIVEVPFVPSSKVNTLMSKIHAAYSQSRDGIYVTPYITFSEGTTEDYEVLVWTSAHILPDWANPYKLTEHDVTINYPKDNPLSALEAYRHEIGRILRVADGPPLDVVVDHVQNICGVVIGKSDEGLELRGYMKVDVMTKVYKYLQSRITDGSSGQSREELQRTVHRLSDTPCIVSDLGQTFVRPKQVVISLYDDDQIYPFLNQMPTELGEFKRLFLHLGATMSATAEQYANVLESMYLQTGGEKLHPNEMRLAFKAVNGLFTNLRKHRHSDVLGKVHSVYLPTKIGHLFRSTEIVFNDNAKYADRIRNLGRPFLVDLNECWLNSDNHEDTVKLLPPRLRPAMLSDIVQEVLEDRSRDTVVLHSVADKLKYQISSRAFAQGLIRLIRSEHRRSGHRVRQTVLDSIEQHLRKIHVYGVEKIVTFLAYEGMRLSGSESECECFVDKKVDEDSGVESWNIFINKSIILNEELQVSIAEVICGITGGLLKNSIHYIQPILSCAPHSISKVLDRLKVRPDHNIGDVQQPTLPAPGSFIPIEDHHLLKEDFEEFEMGEYVGFELDDDESGMPTVIYAVILERIEEEEFYHVKKLDSDEPATCTAHRKLTQRYRINIGEDRQPTLALATDLYKFHRVDGLMSRSGSVADQPGRPTSTGNPKSPKPNYRESFYRSSIFEPEDSGLPKPWERSPADGFRSPGPPRETENGEYISDNHFDHSPKRPTASPGVTRSNGQFKPDLYEFRSSHEDDSGYNRTRDNPDTANDYDQFPNYQHSSDGILYPQLPPGTGIDQPEDFQSAFEAGVGPSEEDLITTERVMTEVSDTLEEAWQLPEGQRKKIIKRLLLKWHPDKNIGNEMFATVIMQHIQAEIERLELGLPRPTNFDTSNFNFDPRNPFTSNETFQKNFASAYQFFFEQMNQRAKEHREQRERYQENFSREYNAGKGDYNFDVPPTFSSTNPQPAQAKRFLRQAQEDLRAADNDYDAQDPAFEWACFKAHQAAEKALKAAQFAVDAVTSFSHDLVTLAASLEDVELRRLAQKLQKIVGNSNKLYNPDPIDFVVIPHEEYTREMACDAVMCAVDVLERVKEFVELRDST